ncbi:MAG: tRNA (N6-isopentenyl adenosine(37)-C2)-methylthiotransferase MiaB [Lachnospiraceae bacterium]|nr:tRNA (N6-isopentenyl adenosine(37)-C2)-methylthiotransferase MiaB [Lachnospiraceae bacterium]
MKGKEEIIPEKEPQRQYYFIEMARKLREEKEREIKRPLTFHVTTFGCQMNARDSEKLEGILKAIGYTYEEKEEEADLVLFNTCTIRDNADQKVYGRLGYLHGKNHYRKDRIIALCGCMMQEVTAVEKIKKSYSFVNIIFGTHNVYKLAELLCIQAAQGNMVIDILDGTDLIVEDIPNSRKYPFKSGINIMYGCNNFCTYCIVPYVRGRERSRPSKDIIREIERLAEDGVREIMLLGQNVNSYGKGIKDELSFSKLLKEAERVEGIERIRFMTSHPKDLSDELIEVMRDSDKICRHIHLPLQSGSDKILKRMNRSYTRQQYIDLALKIRREIPDIAITTDIIVGFPGETKEDVDDTLDVMEKVRYDGAFTFIYSKRSNTPAATMPDQVTKEQNRVQFDRVLKKVQEISKEMAQKRTGNIEKVLVEEISDHDAGFVSGRLSSNLVVHFEGSESLIGQIVDVRLDECRNFYYIGKRV